MASFGTIFSTLSTLHLNSTNYCFICEGWRRKQNDVHSQLHTMCYIVNSYLFRANYLTGFFFLQIERVEEAVSPVGFDWMWKTFGCQTYYELWIANGKLKGEAYHNGYDKSRKKALFKNLWIMRLNHNNFPKVSFGCAHFENVIQIRKALTFDCDLRFNARSPANSLYLSDGKRFYSQIEKELPTVRHITLCKSIWIHLVIVKIQNANNKCIKCFGNE